MAVHYARNVLAGRGDVPGQVPLVLGIWGPKGAGKTFSLELCLRAMGVLPVCLSAGELEDEWAGEPGRRLRERYSFAGRLSRVEGRFEWGALNVGGAGWQGVRMRVAQVRPRLRWQPGKGACHFRQGWARARGLRFT